MHLYRLTCIAASGQSVSAVLKSQAKLCLVEGAAMSAAHCKQCIRDMASVDLLSQHQQGQEMLLHENNHLMRVLSCPLKPANK